MRRLVLLLLPLPLAAHMVSISTGEIRIEGETGKYALRMPLYEVAHIRNADRVLFKSVRFSSGGTEAELLNHSCQADTADGSYSCSAVYRFAARVDALDVDCRFYTVTVPNHVHLLRAVYGGKTDQAVLDFTFPTASLRFQPPSSAAVALGQIGSGVTRAAGGAVQILFLASLVLAARGRKELFALTAMFLLGKILSCLALPLTGWQPAPRFAEAAAALTIAYLAVEILVLPEAGKRWLVVGVLGIFHGFYFALFVKSSGYQAAYVLAGAAMAEVILIGLFALVFAEIKKAASAFRPVQVAASLLLATGLAWFVLRMRG